MTNLFAPLTLTRGPAWKNRFMLAPLTNSQSHTDGTLSDDEFRWLTLRASGDFGLVMTCAAHVQARGQGFAGQLGTFGDEHLAGLTRLAKEIRSRGAVSSVQLHHAGFRSPADLIGETPVAPSENAEFACRALTGAEIEQLTEDFIAAAVRSEKAGFDGVELHGAHGYIICAFLSPETNVRTDAWGGTLAGRSKLLLDIIAGVRARCRPDFQLGVRLSPERFGMQIGEARDLATQLMTSGDIDYLDMSLWDVFKIPNEADYAAKTLIDWFADLPRGATRLGAAGKIMNGASARQVMQSGVDFTVIGRAAVLHHDYPRQIAADPDFEPIARPVSRAHLRAEGLSETFVNYMNNWKGFVAPEEAMSETV